MSEDDQDGIGLFSKSPTARAKAVTELRRDPFSISSRDLLQALQRETVPRLRLALNEILESRKKTSDRRLNTRPHVDYSKLDRVSEDGASSVGSLARHELSPAIGWIRRAANHEIPNFQESATNVAIGKLQRRLNGLIALTKSGTALQIETVVLAELLTECWPDPNTGPRLQHGGRSDSSALQIDTDVSLFSAMLSNVYQNAIDAAAESQKSDPVQIAWGRSQESFWVRISNPFVGQRFSLADVLTGGLTSKTGHQGQGLGVITASARQLGLSFDVAGESGTAISTIQGKLTNG